MVMSCALNVWYLSSLSVVVYGACLARLILTTPSVFRTADMAKWKPVGLKWRSSTLFIVSTVGIGLFTDLFLYGLVVPILPFILRDRMQLQPDQIQSHVSTLLAAYAGASVLFSLPAGIIADRLPTRQLPFLVGLTALLLATLLLFLGQNVAVLVVARILQGVSAAVVWTVGLALVLDTVGPGNLGKTIGSVCRSGLYVKCLPWLKFTLDIRVHINWRIGCAGPWRRYLQQERICGCIWPRFRHTSYRLYHAAADN